MYCGAAARNMPIDIFDDSNDSNNNNNSSSSSSSSNNNNNNSTTTTTTTNNNSNSNSNNNNNQTRPPTPLCVREGAREGGAALLVLYLIVPTVQYTVVRFILLQYTIYTLPTVGMMSPTIYTHTHIR